LLLKPSLASPDNRGTTVDVLSHRRYIVVMALAHVPRITVAYLGGICLALLLAGALFVPGLTYSVPSNICATNDRGTPINTNARLAKLRSDDATERQLADWGRNLTGLVALAALIGLIVGVPGVSRWVLVGVLLVCGLYVAVYLKVDFHLQPLCDNMD
jgi:hypothetical protein